MIKNDTFTSLEAFRTVPDNSWQRVSPDNGFLEINNSWYIDAHYESKGISCKYKSFDEFMNTYFSDYIHLNWLRFAPGTQYVVDKGSILGYTKSFWEKLSAELTSYAMTESFMIERAMLYILTVAYTERK